MFNKISSKLRNRSGFGNGQKDKSFAYGKMQKPGDQSLLSEDFSSTQSKTYSSISWTGTEEHEEDEEEEQEPDQRKSSFNFAESIFPISTVSSGSLKKSRPLGDKLSNAGDYVSGEGWSFEEQENEKSWNPPSSVQWDVSKGSTVLKDYEDAEEDFLGDFEEYFENLSVDNIRKEQYPKLDVQRLVYLDYANCGLFSTYQVQEHMKVLLEEGPCLGLSETGFNISNHVSDAQNRIFELLNTDRSTFAIIFTTGFTQGFQLMGQAFPFQKSTPLLVCQDSHEAVQSLIKAAGDRGAKPILAPIVEADLSLNGTELRRLLGRRGGGNSGNGGLFVFPVQSCLSGVVHSLTWVAEAQQNGWHVLIDTSTYLPTGRLDLSMSQPDFVVGSISHLLGYPSGFGFLLVRKNVFRVQTADYDNKKVKFIRLSPSSEEVKGERDCLVLDESNILNALSFSAVAAGLAHLEMVGHEAIHKRVRSLAAWLLRTLLSLQHKGDLSPPLARVYGPPSARNKGNIIAFNILDSTGNELPPGLIRRLAEKNNIFISEGHLSSPGVTNLLGPASNRVRDAGVFEQNSNRFSLLRVSLGPLTNFQDVYMFAHFLSRFRDEDYLSSEAMGFYEDNPQD